MNHEPRLTGNKVCVICDETKGVLHFAVARENADGLATYCRACKGIVNKADRALRAQKLAEKRHDLKYGRDGFA